MNGNELLRYGVNADNDRFSKLSQDHPLLFRLHEGPASVGLIAKAFRTAGLESIPQRPETDVYLDDFIRHISEWRFPEVERTKSEWLSCTMSFPWILWETQRRSWLASYPINDLYISIIDSRHMDLSARHTVWMGAEAVRVFDWADQNISARKLRLKESAKNFTQASQEVLVYGYVPQDAVIVTIPCVSIQNTFYDPYLGCNPWPHFRDFCNFMGAILRHENIALSRQRAVRQATSIIGGLRYPNADSRGVLDRYADFVYQFARSLVTWPHRKRDGSLENWREPLDKRFPDLDNELVAEVKQQPSYLRASAQIFAKDIERLIQPIMLMHPSSNLDALLNDVNREVSPQLRLIDEATHRWLAAQAFPTNTHISLIEESGTFVSVL